MELSAKILSDIVVHAKYARYLEDKKRRENWEEIVERNKNMHIKKFSQLKEEIEKAYQFVIDKKVLPSGRSLQFAGRPIEINPARNYNCSFTAVDSWEVFSEILFLLLSGAGVGISVQKADIDKLPEIIKPFKKRRFLIEDSIIGWCDSIKVLMKSYFFGKPQPDFDYDEIRPEGARLVTSGGKAPGPGPLKDAHYNIRKILDKKQSGEKLEPIEVCDIVCYLADCVLSGGVRRSSVITFFSLHDEAMLSSKFGRFWEQNPQRSRTNNSAVLLRYKIKEKDFRELWQKIKLGGTGEPAWIFTNDPGALSNPCSELNLKSNSFCCLTEVNASDVESQEDFNERVKAAAFIATLQSSYTDFFYLRDIWKANAEKEGLIGVGLTGIASGRLDKLNLDEAAECVKEENKRVAKLIGVNRAYRTCTVKPSGTSSLVLGTSSGIHAWHSEYYIRRMRVNKNESIYKYLKKKMPNLVEDDFQDPIKTAIIAIPIKAPDGAITRSEEDVFSFLKRIKRFHEHWIKPGHLRGSNTNNVSCTVSIKDDQWDKVGDWVWENRDSFNAISVIPFSDHTYHQMPFEEITKEKYEEMFAELKDIDLDKVKEEDDNTNFQGEIACGGKDSCEIR